MKIRSERNGTSGLVHRESVLGKHRAGRSVAPTGHILSGPLVPAITQRIHPVSIVALVLVTGAVLGGVVAQITPTHAMMSSTAQAQINVVRAGSWMPPVPAECGDPGDYKGGIVYGTDGDDVIHGGNQAQIIMGLDGNDIIYGGNSGDCLVGGPGNDTLYGGTAKDILLGGPGDDRLYGGNGKDILDAGAQPNDFCDGGTGKDTLVGCPAPAEHELIAGAPASPDPTNSNSADDANDATAVNHDAATPEATP